jgi:hypothetical protein
MRSLRNEKKISSTIGYKISFKRFEITLILNFKQLIELKFRLFSFPFSFYYILSYLSFYRDLSPKEYSRIYPPLYDLSLNAMYILVYDHFKLLLTPLMLITPCFNRRERIDFEYFVISSNACM